MNMLRNTKMYQVTYVYAIQVLRQEIAFKTAVKYLSHTCIFSSQSSHTLETSTLKQVADVLLEGPLSNFSSSL